MWEAFKDLLKQPYWVIALLLGVALITFPCVTVDKDFHWKPQPPSTLWPMVVGIALLLVSAAGFAFTLWSSHTTNGDNAGTGLDLTKVKDDNGVLSTKVSGCEIKVAEGRIEEYPRNLKAAVVLPCNEYFDDNCIGDTRSALGAYVNRSFEGQASAFSKLIKEECAKKLGASVTQQKTDDERGESFGSGRCLLLIEPLNRSVSIALVSTTTQRAGQGLSSRISYLFDGMRQLVARLADARLDEVVMPILGAGHGGIDPPLALVGLLLAVAEAARYGQGGQRLKKVTIVVYRQDAASAAEVDKAVVRRALALIGSRN